MFKQIKNIKVPHLYPSFSLQDIQQISPFYEGEFCDVYKINKHGQELALKVIYANRITYDVQQKINRICTQIKTLYSIKHENIIQLLGHWHVNDIIVLIFPMFGKTLYDFIKQRKKKAAEKKQYKLEDFIKIFRGIGSGLAELHAMGLIHRDLSEDNVLIDQNLNIKLIDFQSIGNIEDSTGTFGTRQYLAPQILLGQHYNHKIDVWAFGILCYQLLYCTYLFKPKVKNLQQLGQDQIVNQYLLNMKQPIEDFPHEKLLISQPPSPQLIAFLKSMLNFNPDKRPEIGYLLSKPIFGANDKQSFNYNMEQYVRQKTSRRTYKVNPGLHSNVKQMSVRQLQQTLINLMLLESKQHKRQKQLLTALMKQQIQNAKGKIRADTQRNSNQMQQFF